MTFFGYPRGHRVKSETLVFEQHGGLTSPVDTLPRTKRLKNPIGPPLRMIPRMERTLCQRRSSCLFQIVGVETCSFLPDNQGDRGNLPRQGETSHRWSHPFGEQGLVKIAERSIAGAGSHGRTLEDILEIVVVVIIQPTKLLWLSRTLQLSLDIAVLRAVVRFQRQPTVGPQLALSAEPVG